MAPYCLRVCRGSKGKARGVWAVHSIESWAWFGPLEGEILPAKENGSTPPPQTWEIFCGEQVCHLLGVNNGTNWLNHVTSTYVTWSAVNMAAYQYRGQIFYVTTKVIGQGQELVLGLDFSNHYQTLVNWKELKQRSKDFANKKTCIVCRRHYDDIPLAARRSDWRSQALNVQVEIDDFLPTLKLSPSEVYDRLRAPNKQVQENSRRLLSGRIFCCHKCGWKFGTFVRYALHKRNHHLRYQRCRQTKTREDGLKSGGYVHEIAVESEVQGTVMEHSRESKLNEDVAVETEKNKKAEASGDSLEENTSRRHEHTETQLQEDNKESGDTGRLRPLEDGRPLVQNTLTECLEECNGSGDAGRLTPLENGQLNTTKTADKSAVRKAKETRVENGLSAGRNLRQRKLPPKYREDNKCKQTTSDAKRPDVSKLTPSLVVNGAKKSDRFSCTLCTKSFTSNSNLGKHVRIHTGEKPHECDHCGKRFSEASNLRTHLRVHTEHNPYECQTCHKRFKYLKGFKMHLAQHERSPVTHKCGVCDREFDQKGPCTTHEKSHQREKPFRCTVCKMKFKREGGLQMHLEKMHPRPTPSYKNGVLRKKRGKGKETNVDVKPRQGGKEAFPHRCQDCGKEFKYNYSLKQHRRIHTGEKPFKCTQCGAAFSQSANLTSHRRIHTGEKPYECRQCDKRFACAQNLRSHLRVHTGERPYKCPQCPARFAYSSYLKTHSLVHSDRKPLKCEECGKEYRHPASFKSHCRTHAKK